MICPKIISGHIMNKNNCLCYGQVNKIEEELQFYTKTNRIKKSIFMSKILNSLYMISRKNCLNSLIHINVSKKPSRI